MISASGPTLSTRDVGLGEQEARLQDTIDTLNDRIRRMRRTTLLGADDKFTVDSPQKLLAISHNRLLDTENVLQGNAWKNRRVGIQCSFWSLAPILGGGLIVYFFTPPDTGYLRVLSYLPFLTAGIALQLVGVFFLKTFRIIESDIKQNKNEITNIEMRIAAVLMAENNIDLRSEITRGFLTEERNFILKKDEKTAGEARKAEIDDMRATLDKLINKLPNGGA